MNKWQFHNTVVKKIMRYKRFIVLALLGGHSMVKPAMFKANNVSVRLPKEYGFTLGYLICVIFLLKFRCLFFIQNEEPNILLAPPASEKFSRWAGSCMIQGRN